MTVVDDRLTVGSIPAVDFTHNIALEITTKRDWVIRLTAGAVLLLVFARMPDSYNVRCREIDV